MSKIKTENSDPHRDNALKIVNLVKNIHCFHGFHGGYRINQNLVIEEDRNNSYRVIDEGRLVNYTR